MPRIKIDLPGSFTFSTQIPVRISDINYAGHMGNDALLSILHDTRLQYLQHYGYSELDFAGKGLIMADVGITYKAEAFRGDVLIIRVTANDFTKYGFDLVYEVRNQEQKVIAVAKTGMVCFDYQTRKLTSLPQGVTTKLAVI